MLILAIGLGGALGAIARYALGGFVHRLTPSLFPYGTLVVNLTGCLCFGLVAGLAESRFAVGSFGRAFIMIGVLGGFTTFSTFTFETFELLRSGQTVQAAANVFGQVLIGLVALMAGFVAGRAL
jgi:CrcB protein